MIIYSKKKVDFLHEVPDIAGTLESRISEQLQEESSEAEILSWQNSLDALGKVLESDEIPDDAGVALEYNIPGTNNRVDVIVTGCSKDGDKLQPEAVLIELKQWQKIQPTKKDGIVITRFAEGEKETPHPSYQVSSYASLLENFKMAVEDGTAHLHPCVYMHNFEDDGVIRGELYEKHVEKAEVFCKGEEERLLAFLRQYIQVGDGGAALEMIENSETIPSKKLVDSIIKVAEGNPVFRMIDEQKVVYETIVSAYEECAGCIAAGKEMQKQVIIVNGGPGTGKSVIALQVVVEMTRRKLRSNYITKNNAPRNALSNMFQNELENKNLVRPFFSGSGSFVRTSLNWFDVLLADEAHRLVALSGSSKKKFGENQVKEIINASKVSVFFLDERQKVSLKDIGSRDEIRKWADLAHANVSEYNLTSQFRCSGSDEFINWLDHLLQYDGKQAIKLSGSTYDFRVFDDVSQMMEEIRRKNKNGISRMVAGFCWEWGKDDTKTIHIRKNRDSEETYDFKWNLHTDPLWAVSPESLEEVGCIHTCQGLEFDYVGVIIGYDLVYQDGKVLVNPARRAEDDYSIRGWREMMDDDREGTRVILREIIKNTYRTLMTRGMKGCFVYACDENLRAYIKESAASKKSGI